MHSGGFPSALLLHHLCDSYTGISDGRRKTVEVIE